MVVDLEIQRKSMNSMFHIFRASALRARLPLLLFRKARAAAHARRGISLFISLSIR